MAKLYFRYSTMNAGKSTSLLQIAHNYFEHGKPIMVVTAAVDDRYGVGQITSRLGVSREADYVYNRNTVFEEPAHPVDCILVDEAQFLTKKQVVQLHKIAALKGIPVMCFGLRSDFQGNAFEGSAALLAIADDLEELKTICSCGKKAVFNQRVDEEGNPVKEGSQVEIGGNNRYKAVCATCFYK